MNILCPIDFSNPSKVAAEFAFKYARAVNGNIHLLHANNLDSHGNAEINFRSNKILDVMKENARQDWSKFEASISESIINGTNYTFSVENGKEVVSIINSYVDKHDINIIIMGTKGASGLKKVIMGSQATAVIEKSKVPVITVPENGNFDEFSEVVYATDMKDFGEELDVVIPFVKKFQSKLHILHTEDIDITRNTNYKSFEQELQQKYEYPDLQMAVRINDDVGDSIEKYLSQRKVDLLIMFTHRPTFFEKLLGASVTRELAFHSKVPILSVMKHHSF